MWLRVLKKGIYWLFAFGLLGIFVYLTWFSFHVRDIQKQEDLLQVHVLDVGQGDSIFIQTPYGHRILIDGGPSARVTNQLASHIPFYDKRIDLVILTHPHADHVIGLTEVLKQYQVQTVMHTGVLHTTDAYIEFLDTLKEKSIHVDIIEHPRVIELASPKNPQLEPLQLHILYPITSFLGQRVSNLNNTSIVVRLVYENTSFLFMGDLEKEGQQQLMQVWTADDLHAQVIKIAHQGSRDSLVPEFMRLVSPVIGIITAGEKNSFGHPHQEVIAYLEKEQIQIYRTDKDGTISLYSDGNEIEVTTR